MFKRALIIDDNEADVKLIAHALKEENIAEEIVFASSGEEGIEKAEKTNPDLVISDINMSGMGGMETCTEIRQKDTDVKIMLLSDCLDEDQEQKASRLGIDVCSKKGVVLIDTLKQVFIELSKKVQKEAGQ